MEPFADVDALVAALAGAAGTESDEAISGFSALDHGLQCAAALAGSRPGDEELAVAGLVHDLASPWSTSADHGRDGAAVVRPLLGDRVATLVEAHVTAKRFLVATDPAYRAVLSARSTETLAQQGEALAPDEVAAFAARPDAADAVALRRADDSAKVPGRRVPPLDAWVPVLRRVAEGAAR